MSQHLKKTLLQTAGQHATLTYHRPLGAFTGSVVSALMLSQLLFWHTEDGEWKPVRDRDWKDLLGEAAVTDYRLRECRKQLEEQEIIETKLAHHKGAPTHHYRLNMDELIRQWEAFTERKADLPEEESSSGDKEPREEAEEDRQEEAGGEAPSEDSPGEPPASVDPEEEPIGDLLALDPQEVTPEVARAVWNDFANGMREEGFDIPRVRKMTEARKGYVRSKREDYWPDMRELLLRVRQSEHLRGENEREWTVSFNWIWKYENNCAKILEGNYNNGFDPDAPLLGPAEAESEPQTDSYDSVGWD
jgi:hypothetical protein